MANLPLEFTLLTSAPIPKGAASANDLKALADFVLHAERVKGPVVLSLDLTGHRRIQSLNRHFRGVESSPWNSSTELSTAFVDKKKTAILSRT